MGELITARASMMEIDIENDEKPLPRNQLASPGKYSSKLAKEIVADPSHEKRKVFEQKVKNMMNR